MSEKDKAVVASMVRAGMSLEVLKKSFPQFDEKDVEQIYLEEKEATDNDYSEKISLSCNCS